MAMWGFAEISQAEANWQMFVLLPFFSTFVLKVQNCIVPAAFQSVDSEPRLITRLYDVMRVVTGNRV